MGARRRAALRWQGPITLAIAAHLTAVRSRYVTAPSPYLG